MEGCNQGLRNDKERGSRCRVDNDEELHGDDSRKDVGVQVGEMETAEGH